MTEHILTCTRCGGQGGVSYSDDARELLCLPCAVPPPAAYNGNGPAATFAPRKPDVDNVRPVVWAWRQRIPIGNISLLVGEEGVGKGVVLAWLIARLSRGELPGDLYSEPANVLVVGDEDSFDDVWVPRLLAANADLERVRDLPPSDVLGLLDVKRDVDHLRQIVREGEFRVVVFDALLDNLPDTTDEFKPRSVRAALRPLGRLARHEAFAALGSLHTNKAGDSFRQKMSGSHAFNALARSGLLLAQHPDDEDRRVLARGKGNLSKRPPALEFTIGGCLVEVNGYRLDVPHADDFRDGDLTVEDLLAPPGEADALTAACEFLEQELMDGPRPTTDLKAAAEEAAIGWRTVERAKQRIGVRARKTGTSWTWEFKTAKKTATSDAGGVGGVGGVEPEPAKAKTAKTAKTATSTHGGLDGGLDDDARAQHLLTDHAAAASVTSHRGRGTS